MNVSLLLRLELSEAVPGLTGATFNIESVPKTGFVFTTQGNKMETGTDFRYESIIYVFSITDHNL